MPGTVSNFPELCMGLPEQPWPWIILFNFRDVLCFQRPKENLLPELQHGSRHTTANLLSQQS